MSIIYGIHTTHRIIEDTYSAYRELNAIECLKKARESAIGMRDHYDAVAEDITNRIFKALDDDKPENNIVK